MPETAVSSSPAKPVDLSKYRGFRTKEELWSKFVAAAKNGIHSAHYVELLRQFNSTRFYLLNDDFAAA